MWVGYLGDVAYLHLLGLLRVQGVLQMRGVNPLIYAPLLGTLAVGSQWYLVHVYTFSFEALAHAWIPFS